MRTTTAMASSTPPPPAATARRHLLVLSSLSVTSTPLLATVAAILLSPLDLTSALSLSSSPPSWEALRSDPALSKPPPPTYRGALPDDIAEDPSLPIFYRDEECVCAASETIWLALECKGVDHLTVLASKDDEGTVPRVVWPDDGDEATTDPAEVLEQIQKRYPDSPPQFYPRLSSAVDASRCNILRLPGVMPRNSDPDLMYRAPYLFREDGTQVKRSSHRVSLEEVEEMQEEYYLGDYLCGRDVSAADLVWAPYLERYAIQLPLLHPNIRSCDPRSKNYGEVAAWYAAMERVPAYACRVAGDARHWRRTLEEVVPLHNKRASSDDERVELPPLPKEFGWWMKKVPNGEKLWKDYRTASRPWLADTPAGEVAMHVLRNRERLTPAIADGLDVAQEEADEALRELVGLLLNWKMDDTAEKKAEIVERSSESSRRAAVLLCDRLEVPRDIGMVPASALAELACTLVRPAAESAAAA